MPKDRAPRPVSVLVGAPVVVAPLEVEKDMGRCATATRNVARVKLPVELRAGRVVQPERHGDGRQFLSRRVRLRNHTDVFAARVYASRVVRLFGKIQRPHLGTLPLFPFSKTASAIDRPVANESYYNCYPGMARGRCLCAQPLAST